MHSTVFAHTLKLMKINSIAIVLPSPIHPISHNRDIDRFCDASLETGGTGITRVYFR